MNTNKQSVVIFLQRAFLFFSPILLFVLVIEWGLWRSGESWPAARVAEAQYHGSQKSLYSRAFMSQQMNLYKAAGIKMRTPSVLVLGSSRVMQFRDFMFHPMESSFYNAGGMIQGVSDLTEYVRKVADKELPAADVLIVGIDPWWFNPNYGRPESWLNEEDAAVTFGGHLEAVRSALRRKSFGQILRSVWVPMETPVYRYRSFGLQALRTGAGFRHDGSLQVPPEWLIDFVETPVYVDRESNPVLGRVHRLSGKFSATDGPDRSKGDELIVALGNMRLLGAEVIVFFPPFSKEVFDALCQSPDLKTWWSYYTDELADSIRERGFSVCSSLSAEAVGLDDRYMLDGFHPSEVFAGHVLKNILQDGDAGSALTMISEAHLNEQLSQADTQLTFRFKKPGGFWLNKAGKR